MEREAGKGGDPLSIGLETLSAKTGPTERQRLTLGGE